MSVIYTGRWTNQYLNSDTEKLFDNKDDAMKAAAAYVGNTSYASIFNGARLLYGPGDGTTSVTVRAEVSYE